MRPRGAQPGFSLVELLVALAIGALVLAGAVRLATASAAGFNAQQSKARLQEEARFAMKILDQDIRSAGFPATDQIPENPPVAIEPGTVAMGSNDRLALRRWSTHNCYGNPNPITDDDGRPRNWLLLSRYEMTKSGGLTRHCQYGASPGELVTQMNRLSLARNVRAFRVHLAIDLDSDGQADEWRDPGQAWTEQDVMAIRYRLEWSDGPRRESRMATVGLRGRERL